MLFHVLSVHGPILLLVHLFSLPLEDCPTYSTAQPKVFSVKPVNIPLSVVPLLQQISY